MKLNDQYTVTKLADEYVAVPLTNKGKFRGVIKLNESGAEVFQGLIEGQQEEQLVQRLMSKYPTLDSETAGTAVSQVICAMKQAGVLED